MLTDTISRGRMSYQKWLLLVFISPELFPVFHCCFRGSLRLSSGESGSGYQILSPALRLGAYEILCIVRVESLFPTGLQVSCIEALLAFKARYSASCVPGAGAWVWGNDFTARTPPSLVTIWIIIIFLFVCWSPAWGVGLNYANSLTPHQHFWDSFCL